MCQYLDAQLLLRQLRLVVDREARGADAAVVGLRALVCTGRQGMESIVSPWPTDRQSINQ